MLIYDKPYTRTTQVETGNYVVDRYINESKVPAQTIHQFKAFTSDDPPTWQSLLSYILHQAH